MEEDQRTNDGDSVVGKVRAKGDRRGGLCEARDDSCGLVGQLVSFSVEGKGRVLLLLLLLLLFFFFVVVFVNATMTMMMSVCRMMM